MGARLFTYRETFLMWSSHSAWCDRRMDIVPTLVEAAPVSTSSDTVRFYSWNVNGIRAAARKGLGSWLNDSKAAVVGFQETRALPEQFPAELQEPSGWHIHRVSAERKGYSGVALYSRYPYQRIEEGLNDESFDCEGRVQTVSIGRLTVVNAYFPNGNGSVLANGKRSNDRVPYKLAFYRSLWERLEEAKASGEPMLVMGDFNTAHEALDLARPASNKKTSGFLPEEREEMGRWLGSGWVDTFRHYHPGEGEHYSWWSQRARCRERNVGWRIDYVLASPGLMPYLRGAFIEASTLGSDHCPVGVDLDAAVLAAS